METEKKKYYISVGTGEISEVKYGNNDEFIVYATTGEISKLRRLMNHMHDASWGSFIRSHFPIVPYHVDRENDLYDENLTEAFRMIHQLGDQKTRAHIESMEILGDRPI